MHCEFFGGFPGGVLLEPQRSRFLAIIVNCRVSVDFQLLLNSYIVRFGLYGSVYVRRCETIGDSVISLSLRP